MLYVLYTLHVIVCLFLILVVLLQQGKGADLSVFGGGGTQTAFGPRGATTLLHKLTVWGFVAFTVMTISIGFLTGRGRDGSVMEGVETEQSAPATQPSEPAAAEGEPAATPTRPGAAVEESETPRVESRAGASEPEAGGAEAADDTPAPTEESAPPAGSEEPQSAPDETPQ